MTIEELNKENVSTINASTFRLEPITKGDDKGKLEFYFGDFVDDDSVKVLGRVALSFKLAAVLANSVLVACAEYQHKTGEDVGIPAEFCQKVVSELRKLEKTKKAGGDV